MEPVIDLAVASSILHEIVRSIAAGGNPFPYSDLHLDQQRRGLDSLICGDFLPPGPCTILLSRDTVTGKWFEVFLSLRRNSQAVSLREEISNKVWLGLMTLQELKREHDLAPAKINESASQMIAEV